MEIVQEHRHGHPAFPVAIYPIEYKAGPDFLFFPHYHDEIEFFQIISGSATVWVNTIPYVMHAGDFLIIPSTAIHSCKILDCDTCDTNALLCHPDFLYGRNNDVIFQYLKHLTQPNAAAFFFAANDALDKRTTVLFQEICQLFDTKPPAYELLIKSYLFNILYLAFTANSVSGAAPAVDSAVETIKKSLDYIQVHLGEDISLDELAKQCCLSASQYGRLFKRVTGCTPINYLLEKRIHYAAQLLTETDMLISEVSSKAGFNNFSYFNRCFRRYHRMTPNEFRHRGGTPT